MSYKNEDEQRAYQKAWVKKRRADWIRSHGLCSKCGSSEKLNVHHVDKKQKVDHKVWSWSEVRREEELSKCVVLCVACHARLHGDEVPEPPHGTMIRYKSKRHPCRCVLCREANTAYESVRRLR